jgi:hypothetical protein
MRSRSSESCPRPSPQHALPGPRVQRCKMCQEAKAASAAQAGLPAQASLNPCCGAPLPRRSAQHPRGAAAARADNSRVLAKKCCLVCASAGAALRSSYVQQRAAQERANMHEANPGASPHARALHSASAHAQPAPAAAVTVLVPRAAASRRPAPSRLSSHAAVDPNCARLPTQPPGGNRNNITLGDIAGTATARARAPPRARRAAAARPPSLVCGAHARARFT